MSTLIDVAQETGVEHSIYVSYARADVGLGFPLERAKIANEKLLRASAMRETILRPDAFQDVHLAPLGRFDMQKGKVAVFGRGEAWRRWVSTDDVAALIAVVALQPSTPSLIEFGGPEAISRNEAILVAEQLTGRRMKRQSMPRAAARLGMRLLDRLNPALASVLGRNYRWIRLKDLGMTLRCVSVASNRNPPLTFFESKPDRWLWLSSWSPLRLQVDVVSTTPRLLG